MNQHNQKRLAFIVEHSPFKGDYPFERIATIVDSLKDEAEISILLKTNQLHLLNIFKEYNLSFKTFNHFFEIDKLLHRFKPDVIFFDGKDITDEQMEQLNNHCQRIILFDDFGEGSPLAEWNIVSLICEQKETPPPNMISETFSFVVPNSLKTIIETRQNKELSNPPHIVVSFEEGDENNLTYRTLRHLTQLHIPLQITICIDHNYRHPIEELQLMALSRRNTKIFQKENALLHLLPTADIVICNASYTPYKVAAIGIPSITAAQNEREINNIFPREENGFIHLGIGKKMKQSNIQNAVMEFLLHPKRRERAIQKQLALNINNNNEQLKSFLLDLIYSHQKISN